MQTETRTTDAPTSPQARARRDPAAAYATPAQLAGDERLTVPQRVEMLHRWEHDIRARQVAAGEGMQPSKAAPDLRDVGLALATLGADLAGGTRPHGGDDEPHATTDDAERVDLPYDRIPFGGGSNQPVSRDGAAARRGLGRLLIAAAAGAIFLAGVITWPRAPLLASGGIVLLALALIAASRRSRGDDAPRD